MSTPLPQPSPVRSEAFYGRVVVLLVVAAVVSVTIVAWAIGRFFALNRTAVTPREMFIGSWEVLVSGERPPLNLVLLALLGTALIAFTALSFEIIAALMTISPRRRYLETLRSAGMSADMIASGSPRKRFDKASKAGANILVGVTCRDGKVVCNTRSSGYSQDAVRVSALLESLEA